jgi:hypothetical protein
MGVDKPSGMESGIDSHIWLNIQGQFEPDNFYTIFDPMG